MRNSIPVQFQYNFKIEHPRLRAQKQGVKFRTFRPKKQRKSSEFFRIQNFFYTDRMLCGGDKRDRTADLLNAIQALSQLSYTPIFGLLFRQLLYYSMSVEKVKPFFEKIKNRFAILRTGWLVFRGHCGAWRRRSRRSAAGRRRWRWSRHWRCRR